MAVIIDEAKWRSLLNLAGLGLWITFWPKMLERSLILLDVASREASIIKDVNTVILVLATLLVTAFSAVARHPDTSNQVKWIEKATWPFITGWMLGLCYIPLIFVTLGKG